MTPTKTSTTGATTSVWAGRPRDSALWDIIRADRLASELRWEAAYEADASYRASAEACDDAYAEAEDAIERGDYAGAIVALETAVRYEVDGGDAADAQHALRAVRGEE